MHPSQASSVFHTPTYTKLIQLFLQSGVLTEKWMWLQFRSHCRIPKQQKEQGGVWRRSQNNNINYSEFMFDIRKIFHFQAESLPRVSFVIQWRNLPKEVIKAQFPETLKTRLGKTGLQTHTESYPTLAAGSGQDNFTGDLGTALFGQITREHFRAADVPETSTPPLKRGIKSPANKLLSSPTWIELQENRNGR